MSKPAPVLPSSVKSAVCVFSGGMDSSVLLHLAESKLERLLALSFDYGSKHNKRELQMAKLQTKKLGLEHKIVSLDFMDHLFESSLLSSGEEVPEGSYNEKDMSSTVVPFRNGIMLAVAVGLAETKGIDAVLLGAHTGDRPVYPDCREEFIHAFSKASSLGTESLGTDNSGVKVYAPFLELSKRGIAELGKSLEVDFKNTWTCYKGREIHCGRCAACLERKEALGDSDPTLYES